MAKRILYVEDHFNNMLLIKRIVEAEGHEFLAASDGLSGLDLALTKQPDLIIVDLRLPGAIDGKTLLRQLKSSPTLKGVPAIVLTAYGHGPAIAEAREAGCDGFLHKPADIQQIQAVLRQHVGAPDRPEPAWARNGAGRRVMSAV